MSGDDSGRSSRIRELAAVRDAGGIPDAALVDGARAEIAAKLDEVYEGAKAIGDSDGMAAARLAKLRLYGEIDEAEYRSWLGEDEPEDE